MIFDEVDIIRTTWIKGQMTISLVRDSQGQDITSGKEPHSDYKEALEKLKIIFMHHLELDGYPGMDSRIDIIGAEEKEVKNMGSGYRIHGILSSPATGGRCRISTPTLFVPSESFFEVEDENGIRINEPDEHLSKLQRWEIEAIENLLAEAYEYAIKKKAAKPEQPDLFENDDKAEEAEASAENAVTEDLEEEDFEDIEEDF